MSYSIITISRMFGSGGRTIAKAVAEQLNIPFYDKELIELVAEKSGFHPEFVEERGEHSPFTTTLGYAFIGRDHRGVSSEDLLWQAQCQVIEELASKGPCVIVGRCADYLLRDREDALHVYIYAEKAYRAKRIVEMYGETDVKPEKRLDEKDKKRRVSYDYYTGRNWGHPANYNMILNSGKLGIDETVKLIVEAYQTLHS